MLITKHKIGKRLEGGVPKTRETGLKKNAR